MLPVVGGNGVDVEVAVHGVALAQVEMEQAAIVQKDLAAAIGDVGTDELFAGAGKLIGDGVEVGGAANNGDAGHVGVGGVIGDHGSFADFAGEGVHGLAVIDIESG